MRSLLNSRVKPDRQAHTEVEALVLGWERVRELASVPGWAREKG